MRAGRGQPDATLTLQPVTGSLAAGTYTATIEVLSVASNSTQTINVTFVIVPPIVEDVVAYGSVWESNPPTRLLIRSADFEDRSGHQARSAPFVKLRGHGGFTERARRTPLRDASLHL